MNLSLKFLNLISKHFETHSYINDDGSMVVCVGDDKVADIKNGIVGNVSKPHIRHSLNKRIYEEYVSLSKLFPKEAEKFKKQTADLVENILDQSNQLCDNERALLNKLIWGKIDEVVFRWPKRWNDYW